MKKEEIIFFLSMVIDFLDSDKPHTFPAMTTAKQLRRDIKTKGLKEK